MISYGFVENIDFILVSQKRPTNNPKNPFAEIADHHMKLSMAKEVAMIQRSDHRPVKLNTYAARYLQSISGF
ncbi:antA/AntB antirepressor family protein [Bacillus sp. Sa1BUA2]|uniref:AntA/AntB antirepressor family protein n=1 Tax=Bacillus norwichensis TaxID=2762217 RepID=A0ABR8VIQ4_9BACI|nr:antA/AntB antirepressor family protein [Bacillus norwichensis]